MYAIRSYYDNDGTLIYVANQNTSTIALLKIEENGGLSNSDIAPITVKTPVCIEFVNRQEILIKNYSHGLPNLQSGLIFGKKATQIPFV